MNLEKLDAACSPTLASLAGTDSTAIADNLTVGVECSRRFK